MGGNNLNNNHVISRNFIQILILMLALLLMAAFIIRTSFNVPSLVCLFTAFFLSIFLVVFRPKNRYINAVIDISILERAREFGVISYINCSDVRLTNKFLDGRIFVSSNSLCGIMGDIETRLQGR